VRLLRRAKRRDYAVKLFYLWLPDVSTAIRRVRERVLKGGHDVPTEDIRRRYRRSLFNLARHYLPLADAWAIFDNSGDGPALVAEFGSGELKVVNPEILGKVQAVGKTR